MTVSAEGDGPPASAATQSPAVAVGSTVGGYRLQAVLGRGGMGVVYLAEDPSLGRRAAVKVLSAALASDEVFRQRFLREARLAASLDHPNVVPVYAAGEDGDVLFLAMRYVEGTDLGSLLAERNPLSTDLAVAILAQIAKALDAAHAHGLVHRDVKPANVLLDAGDPPHAYLADFGLTKRSGSATALTSTGEFVGTAHYAAPEQVDSGDFDGRADQYALGCVAYHCLTGSPPFADRDTEMAVLWAQVFERPPKPSDGRPGLPPGADAALSRALSKSPEDRFGSCSEFVGALAAYLPRPGVAAAVSGRPRLAAPRSFDVALSYHRADAPMAHRLGKALESAGIKVFLPDVAVDPLGDRGAQVESALQESSALAVLLGPHSLSRTDRDELRLARQGAASGRLRLVPVLLPSIPDPLDPSALPPFLASRAWVDLRPGVTETTLKSLVAALRAPVARRVHPGDLSAPYRGLRPFEEQDADFFFGRDGDVQRLIEVLKGTSFLAVVGPSGSGKSSLVRAGLVPALKANALPGGGIRTVAVFKPGPEPLTALASQVARLDARLDMADAVDRMRADPRALHLLTTLALSGGETSERVAWVVDQFEEAFTLCPDEEERAAFISNLLGAASAAASRALVILTLRADFYPRVAAYPELAQAVGAHQYLVSPPDRWGLREAVERPAHLAGASFEEGLVDTIMSGVGDEPGSLPLLEHALYELWEQRSGPMLTLEAYRATGGVEGAVARRAEQIYEGLPPERQAVLRRVMLRLTQPGEGTEDTRRRARLAELPAGPEDDQAVDAVVDAMVGARLLTLSGGAEGDPWLEVAHEALIRAWPRLREWLDEDRAGLRLHRRLTEAAQDWDRSSREDGLLYRGARLGETREWATTHGEELNELERDFLGESRRVTEREVERERRTNRRLRGLLVGVALFLILALVAGGVALVQRGRASRAATLATSRELASSSLLQLATDPELSLLLAIQAGQTSLTPEAVDALRQSIQASLLRASVTQPSGYPYRLALSPDGHSVAVVIDDNQQHSGASIVAFGDPTGSKPLRALFKDPMGVWDIAFSPNGRVLVVSSPSGLRVYDARTGRLRTLTLRHVTFGPLAFSQDGRRLLIADGEGFARILDTSTWRLERTYRLQKDVSVWAIAWEPERDRALLSTTGGVQLLDLQDGSVRSLVGGEGPPGPFFSPTDIAVSPDGKTFTTAGEDGIGIWSLAKGRVLKRIPDPIGTTGVAYSGDGRFLLTSSRDGTASLTDVTTGARVVRFIGHSGPVDDAAFGPGDATVVTTSDDGTTKTWSPGVIGTSTPVVRGYSYLWAENLAEDGARLAIPFGEGTRIVDAATGKVVATVTTSALERVAHRLGPPCSKSFSSPSSLSLSASGEVVLTASGACAYLWNGSTAASVATVAPDVAPPYRSPNIFGAVLSPDGSRVLAWGADTTRGSGFGPAAWLAEGSTGNVLERLPGRDRNAEFSAGVFNPEGTRVALGARDGIVQVLAAASGRQVLQIRARGPIESLAFSRDGTRLVGGLGTGVVATWDARTGAPLGSFVADTAGVADVAFSRDDRYLVTSSDDGTVKIWDPESESLLETLPGSSPATTAEFILDNNVIVQGTLYRCEVCTSPTRLLALARSRAIRELTPEERTRYLHHV